MADQLGAQGGRPCRALTARPAPGRMQQGHDLRNGRPAVSEDRVDQILHNLRRQAEHNTWMMMSLMLALCAVLLVAVLVLPLFGLRVAVVTAVATVLGIVVVCYLVCVTRATGRKRPRV